MGKISTSTATRFVNADKVVIDKREQRKRDQALGLVPFAVKLNSELVKQLQALATEHGVDMNTTVADILAKGLLATRIKE